MDKFFSRQILVITLISVMSIYSASLLWDIQTLKNQNRDLVKESQILQKTLEIIQVKYNSLIYSVSERDKSRNTLELSLDSLKKQNESLAFQAKKIQAQLIAAKDEKKYLEEILINKTKQIETLKEQDRSVSEAELGTPDQIRNSISDNENEIKKLNEQNKILQNKMSRLYQTANQKIHEINVAKMALSESVSTAQKKIDDEWNTVNLGDVTTSARPMITRTASFQNEVEEVQKPKPVRTEGHVLAINNEHGFVVIDIGKTDNLPMDAVLEVKKDDLTIATLSVLEIRDAMAACNIKDVKEGQRIEINDLVSILR